jgi:hypothetical protein
MITEDGEHVICDYPLGCDEKIKNHKWGHIKAVGWLFQKNGNAFCPKHVPEWYTKIRKVST